MNELNDLLEHENKKIYEAHGVLARLYRQILFETRVTPRHMDRLLQLWVADPRNAIPDDGKSRSTERGNLIRELSSRDLTWRVFLKGIRLLRPIDIHLEVHLRWSRKKVTIHGFTMRLTDIEIDLEGDD